MDCFNAALNKPKLLIIGHGRHGKDTFADLVVAKMGLSFISSSEFVGRQAIWEQWGKERYAAFSDFFEDRVNHRGLWFNFIVAYNTPNLARTGEEMMAEHDVYVGMRNPDEFYACTAKNLFDYVIWVDGSERHPPEPKESMGLTKDMADIIIDNNGPEINLQVAVNSLQNRLHKEGFDVNWKPMKMYTLEKPATPATEDEDLRMDTEHFQLVVGDHPDPSERAPDPHDPPVQRPLVINDNKPSLEEYIGIINPPLVEEEPLRCNGDCGCEDGSLCHENVCGPISKMVVNPTLEESRKFHDDCLRKSAEENAALNRREHNEAIMSTNWPEAGPQAPLILPPVEGTPDILKVGYHDVGTKGAEMRSNFRMLPETEKWVDQPHERTSLTWKDMPLNSTRVLDHGFFKVLGVMGTDQSIVDAARMSYGRGTKPVNSSANLINYLVSHYHTSPLEMCEIKFHIRMPIFVMRQWVRHRTANLNEYSGRYSEMVRLFYIPELDQICVQNQVNKQGSAEPMLQQNAAHVVDDMIEMCDSAFNLYEDLLEQGVSRETARIILPLNTYTEVVWKLDISNLLKFLRLRDDSHAQWEIRQYAKLVSQAVEEYFPLVFAAYEESRNSENFTSEEVYALVTGDLSHLTSNSSCDRITDYLQTPIR